MALSLQQSDALNSIASQLYDFLPGSGDASWTGHTTFATVARDIGIAAFWPGGSKRKALVRLLTRTLEERPTLFEKLIVTIVREGLVYRTKNPITKAEILALNDSIRKVGFKFPDLWDSGFLDALASKVATSAETSHSPPAGQAEHRRKLDELRAQFYALATQKERQAAGTAFEQLLNPLFALFGLQPRLGYRVTGEQIDGSFVLDQEIYLLEAKWEATRMSEAPLLIFREKIAGKSNVSRGVFIAVNGFTSECLDAITRGKQPNFFLIDGSDLVPVFEGQIDLVILLREKLRLMAETGAVLSRVGPGTGS